MENIFEFIFDFIFGNFIIAIIVISFIINAIRGAFSNKGQTQPRRFDPMEWLEDDDDDDEETAWQDDQKEKESPQVEKWRKRMDDLPSQKPIRVSKPKPKSYRPAKQPALKQNWKQAIILKEILDQPRGKRPWRPPSK
ncbi:hypothetical protein IC620_10155 [Hazenella sp. IB182357]|uniref:Uncharacterized protein n=1 Tax=Polycladospora coralii TaxID=2771432 RepID=A0A926RUA5_9BACL|nr:hypothetical protein [Polycladospora coralii]MBD1372718.1 hypothetical protein [Polycladospora coralii]